MILSNFNNIYVGKNKEDTKISKRFIKLTKITQCLNLFNLCYDFFLNFTQIIFGKLTTYEAVDHQSILTFHRLLL